MEDSMASLDIGPWLLSSDDIFFFVLLVNGVFLLLQSILIVAWVLALRRAKRKQ
jgi:hypothetical protein